MAHKKPVRIDPLTKAFKPGGADSHAHLDSKEFDDDRQDVIGRAQAVGISNLINVFLSPEDYYKNKSYFSNYDHIHFILGIHPCDGLQCTPQCLDEMTSIFLNDTNVKAVGEIGLDFHWNDCPQELQRKAFAMQLEMAKHINKPVVLHCRDAEADCLTLLEAGGFKDYPLLWHCFGGDKELARRIIHNGWHISIPGSVTFPSNKALREACSIIPADRLLLETDCPYLSPVPWRGTRNEPAYIVFTARTVAEVRSEDPQSLWEICGNNTKRFFNL